MSSITESTGGEMVLGKGVVRGLGRVVGVVGVAGSSVITIEGIRQWGWRRQGGWWQSRGGG